MIIGPLVVDGQSNATQIEIWNEDFSAGYGIENTILKGSYGYSTSAFFVSPGFCAKN